MRKCVLLLVMFCILVVSTTVSAARGVVAYFDNYASRKIVIYDYSLHTFSCGRALVGGYLTMERDVVVGNVSFLGLQEFYNLRTEDTFSVFIEQCYLDTQGAMEWIQNNY